MKRWVYDYIAVKLQKHALLAILLDPEHNTPEELANSALDAEKSGADIILLGGSSNVDPHNFFKSLKAIKEKIKYSGIPLVIYTADFNMVSKDADAILYGSVLNSLDMHYVKNMAISSAPLIWKTLEALSTGFLVYEPGGTVGYVLNCQLVPKDNLKVGLAYAMAAELTGYNFVYLEAGSRASETINPEIIQQHRKMLSIPIIIGGGVKTPAIASQLISAGASILVIGTAFEDGKKVKDFADAVHQTKHEIPSRTIPQ